MLVLIGVERKPRVHINVLIAGRATLALDGAACKAFTRIQIDFSLLIGFVEHGLHSQ